MNRILQNETEILVCAVHDDDMRLDCGDHMIPGEPVDDTELSSDHVMAGKSKGEGERGVSLERNLFPSSQACLVCPRPGRPT